MKFIERFIGINLSAEPRLLDLIGEEVVEKNMSVEDIVIIGTDPRLKLAKGLSNLFPDARLTVIDRNKDVETWTEENFPSEENIKVVVGELGREEIEDVGGGDLVIAKHLIHFVPDNQKEAVIREMEEMMGEEGVLLLSVPNIVDLIFKIEIERLENRLIEKVRIGKWPVKSAVWILSKDQSEA